MKTTYKEKENGICLTKCPHGVDCMVHSLTCTLCHCYFGDVDEARSIEGNRIITGDIKCTGYRLGKELNNGV